MFRPALIVAFLAATATQAQTITQCDWRASAQAIVEPWEENSRLFANGAVRVTRLDTIEPALAAVHLLILSPPYNELGERQCRVVSLSEQYGFTVLHFDELSADYVQGEGLILTVPGRLADVESDFTNAMLLKVTVNQATGDHKAVLELGRE